MKEVGIIYCENLVDTITVNSIIKDLWNLESVHLYTIDFYKLLDRYILSTDLEVFKEFIKGCEGSFIYINILKYSDKSFFNVIVTKIDTVVYIYPTNVNIYDTSLISNISHEMRTPINGILGMVSFLNDTDLDNDQKECVEMVQQCSINLLSIINDVLDYSKLDVNKIYLSKDSFNLQECINDINDDIKSKIYDNSILHFNFDIDRKINFNLIGDSNRLQQILKNILYNSVKFTEKGTILLRVTLIPESIFKILMSTHEVNQYSNNDNNNVQYLKFEIIDTGCGIAEEDTDKIFNPFVQCQSTNKSNNSSIGGGTGLGLSICKKLTYLMDGSIWLERSSVNGGSYFIFIIKTKINDKILQNINVNENVNILLSQKKIIIVDSDTNSRENLIKICKVLNMESLILPNVKDALILIRYEKNKYDVCIVNINDDSSYLFVKTLRNNKESPNRDIPFIGIINDNYSKKDYVYFKFILPIPITSENLKEVFLDIFQNEIISTQIQEKNLPLPLSQSSGTVFDQNTSPKNNLRILVAEDVEVNRKILVSFLKSFGYTNIMQTRNGKEALEELTRNEYDILLLDIKMPFYTGDVVCKIITNFYKIPPQISNNFRFVNKKKPVVYAVTAYTQPDDCEVYKKIGFSDIISKPLVKQQLKDILEKFRMN